MDAGGGEPRGAYWYAVHTKPRQEYLVRKLLEGRGIASNLPGVSCVVSDGQDGLLMRPGDALDLAQKMQALLDDSESRQEMGQRGRAKVEPKHDWPGIIHG